MVNWELLKKLIQTLKDEDITGLAVEENGVKYEVSRQANGTIASHPTILHAPVVPVSEPAAGAAKEDDGLVAITSPMVGTFYRSPSPGSPPFVKDGDDVDPAKVVCIIEAMKLFNEIEAEVSGKIVKFLVENGQPVEYGQKLMLIKKA